MIYTIIKIFLYISIGFSVFSFLKPKDTCNPKLAEFTVLSAFFEAKNLSARYSEATVEFMEGKIKISSQSEKLYSVDFDILAPPNSKRACSNSPGVPLIKTSFKFSPKGLKDSSGTIYLRCGKDFLAFSVVSPTGGITSCYFDGKEWIER